MPIEATVKPSVRGAFGGVSKSAEEYVNSYVYKALTDIPTLRMLSRLQKPEDNPIVWSMEELIKLDYGGETVGSALQRFNAVLAGAYRIPYKAMTVSANRVDGLVTKYKDALKVFRTGETFDPDLYSTTEAGHPAYRTKIDEKTGEPVLDGKGNPVKVQDGIVDHEDIPAGLKEAIENFLVNKAAKELTDEEIEALGLMPRMEELGVEFEE